MALQHTDRPQLYEAQLGILHFKMLDDDDVVHCVVSEFALRSRAEVEDKQEQGVETLFGLYRDEVESPIRSWAVQPRCARDRSGAVAAHELTRDAPSSSELM